MLMTFLNAFAAFSNAKESSALTNEDLHHAPQGGNQILLTTQFVEAVTVVPVVIALNNFSLSPLKISPVLQR